MQVRKILGVALVTGLLTLGTSGTRAQPSYDPAKTCSQGDGAQACVDALWKADVTAFVEAWDRDPRETADLVLCEQLAQKWQDLIEAGSGPLRDLYRDRVNEHIYQGKIANPGNSDDWNVSPETFLTNAKDQSTKARTQAQSEDEIWNRWASDVATYHAMQAELTSIQAGIQAWADQYQSHKCALEGGEGCPEGSPQALSARAKKWHTEQMEVASQKITELEAEHREVFQEVIELAEGEVDLLGMSWMDYIDSTDAAILDRTLGPNAKESVLGNWRRAFVQQVHDTTSVAYPAMSEQARQDSILDWVDSLPQEENPYFWDMVNQVWDDPANGGAGDGTDHSSNLVALAEAIKECRESQGGSCTSEQVQAQLAGTSDPDDPDGDDSVVSGTLEMGEETGVTSAQWQEAAEACHSNLGRYCSDEEIAEQLEDPAGDQPAGPGSGGESSYQSW